MLLVNSRRDLHKISFKMNTRFKRQAEVLILRRFLEDKYFNVYRNVLASCKVGENTIAVGDTFSVKTPKNQADIVLVVEQVEENEKVFKDLISTLITDLRDELKQHDITYVNIILIIIKRSKYFPQVQIRIQS